MLKNKKSIINWININHKSGYDSKPLAIFWPLIKRADIQKKTRKRGMNAITTDQILPTKRRYVIPNEAKCTNCERLESKLLEKNSENSVLKKHLKDNNIDVSDPDYTNNEVTFEPRTDSRVEACDTEYLNRHKFLLTTEKHGAIKRCKVDLIKHSLRSQLDGNLNSKQVNFVLNDLVDKYGLFPHGDGFTSEFFRSHREICGYINEYILAERLKAGSQFVVYFDGSPSGKGKNLLSFGFFDENCESQDSK